MPYQDIIPTCGSLTHKRRCSTKTQERAAMQDNLIYLCQPPFWLDTQYPVLHQRQNILLACVYKERSMAFTTFGQSSLDFIYHFHETKCARHLQHFPFFWRWQGKFRLWFSLYDVVYTTLAFQQLESSLLSWCAGSMPAATRLAKNGPGHLATATLDNTSRTPATDGVETEEHFKMCGSSRTREWCSPQPIISLFSSALSFSLSWAWHKSFVDCKNSESNLPATVCVEGAPNGKWYHMTMQITNLENYGRTLSRADCEAGLLSEIDYCPQGGYSDKWGWHFRWVALPRRVDLGVFRWHMLTGGCVW